MFLSCYYFLFCYFLELFSLLSNFIKLNDLNDSFYKLGEDVLFINYTLFIIFNLCLKN